MEIVLFADRNLRSAEPSLGAAVVAEEAVDVIFGSSPRNESGKFRAKLFDLQTGDVASQIFRVSTDVADCAGRSSFARISAPCGPFFTFGINRLDEPALRIFSNYLQDFSQLPL